MKKFFILMVVVIMVFSFPTYVLAEENYEETVIEMHRLSEKAVEFLREHNVDFEIFRDATVYPDDYPVQYNRQIESLILETEAYGFSDEQLESMVKGIINSRPVIFGGKYDNTGRVQITVPSYSFFINGEKLDYENSLYPLISYKGVSYFPMTWDYSRMLGVVTEWSHEEGFRVKVEDDVWKNPTYETAFNQAEYLYAEVPTYSISINGVEVDNSDREYPFINFRNITYFPLISEITEELNWNCSFDDVQGLLVSKN